MTRATDEFTLNLPGSPDFAISPGGRLCLSTSIIYQTTLYCVTSVYNG